MNDETWLIVGLGNPGNKYEKTWHNLGFMVLDYISQKNNIAINKIKFKGIYGQGRIADKKIILLKPATFMNNSGESVREACDFFKITPERLIVIYDDIDIEAGKIRIRAKGSAGTHNGMKSLITHINNTSFPRIRVGCGPLPEKWNIVDFVLSEIPGNLHEAVFDSIKLSSNSVEIAIKDGIMSALNTYNKKDNLNNSGKEKSTTEDEG